MGNRDDVVRLHEAALVAILIILIWLIPTPVWALGDGGRTAADFLRIGFGARATGLGGAYSAIAEGADAAYWNPAGISRMESTGEVALGHISWYQDINIEYGAAALRVSDALSIGTSVAFLSYGSIDGYRADGPANAQLISAYDLIGGVCLSFRLSESIALGVTGKVINQKLDDINATGAAFDAGLTLHFGDFSMAAVASNFGPALKFEDASEKLPSSGRLGLAWNPASSVLRLAVDLEQQQHGNMAVHSGAELDFAGQYYLRGGLQITPGDQARGLGNGASVGGGLRLGGTAIDYAFTPGDQFSSVILHRLSVTFSIGH